MPPALVACITAAMSKPSLALTLTAFRADALAFEDGAPFPSRLVICPTGKKDARGRGKVIVNAETFSGLEDRQNDMKLGMILALDAEHCTVPGTSAYLADKEPRAVLAWATLSGSLEEGLVYESIKPTPLGMEAWKNKQFQDVSPAVFRRADGTVLAVHSAALCRHGELDGLTIEAATAPKELAPFFAALSASLSESPSLPVSPSSNSPMKPTASLLTLLALLGSPLSADADEAAVDKTLTDLAEKIKAEKDNGKPSDVTALTADFDKRLKAVESERDQAQRDRLKAEATNAGKVIPLDDATWNLTPLSVCAALVAGLQPGVVPMQPRTTTTEAAQDKPDAFSADALEVFTKMGVTEDEVRAADKAA